ncbi:MAG: DnaJ C-terminal domain-containing protein [Aquisalimonadaceae bacterium]
MKYKDYYKILGVERGADSDVIKRAYRRLARKYHPDVSKEPDAEARFKEVSEAYEALSDPEKRAAYDQLGAGFQQGQDFRPPPGWEFHGHGGPAGFGQGQADETFSDFFESLFGGANPFADVGGFESRVHARHGRARGGRRQGGSQTAAITISLEDAFHGATRTVSLSNGQGGSRSLRVKIPAGVTEGQQIRLGGQGESGSGGGQAGDLYLKISIAPHRQYRLEGRDVHLELPVTPWEAALGAQLKVPTLGGWIDMKIPAGSQAGKRFRLRGRGLPGNPPGDQYVTLQIVAPRAETETARELYRRMQKEMPINPRGNLTV